MINDGDFVILKRDSFMRVVQAKKNGRPIILDKKKFFLDNLIGKPYGSSFDIDVKTNQLIPRAQDFSVDDTDLETTSGVDNRNLIGANEDNQGLDKDSINALKKDGLTGHEVMTELIKNSATFNQKTKFSQEKWIKKKKKRHMTMYTVLKPCTRLIADMYYQKDPSKICFLRMDTLSQILTHGNIHGTSKVLLVETCQGLVAGAILHRLTDDGKLVQLFTGPNPMKGRNAFDDFAFSKDTQKSRLKLYPLNLLHELSVFAKNKLVNNEDEGDAPPDKKLKVEPQATLSELDIADAIDYNGDKTESEKNSKKNLPDTAVHNDLADELQVNVSDNTNLSLPVHLQERNASKHFIESNLFDVLVVAVKYQPTQLVLHLIKLIKMSRPIVIYHQHKEPLMELFVQLKERGGLVNLRLSETWLREIQVLPDRTHPAVNMSGTSGYILTATTVER